MRRVTTFLRRRTSWDICNKTAACNSKLQIHVHLAYYIASVWV